MKSLNHANKSKKIRHARLWLETLEKREMMSVSQPTFELAAETAAQNVGSTDSVDSTSASLVRALSTSESSSFEKRGTPRSDVKMHNGGRLSFYECESGKRFELTTGKIENKGRNPANFTIAVYASKNNTKIDDEDILLTTYGCYLNADGLKGDEKPSVTIPNIDTSCLGTGKYYICWKAINVTGNESATGNNAAYCDKKQLTITTPARREPTLNLGVYCGGGYANPSARSGNDIFLTMGKIENTGMIYVSQFKITFYASLDSNINANDYKLKEVIWNGGLAPKESMELFYKVKAKDMPNGEYYIGWHITDVVWANGKSDSNFFKSAHCTITEKIDQGKELDEFDLRAESAGTLSRYENVLKSSSVAVEKGKTFRLSGGAVRNVGKVLTQGYKVTLYASTSMTGSNSIKLQEKNYTSLGANETQSIDFDDISTNSLANETEYYIYWVISDAYAEINTENNKIYCSSKLSIGSKADIQASNGGSLSIASVKQGEEFTLTTGMIRNGGNADTSGFKVTVYASTDKMINTSDIKLTEASFSLLSAGRFCACVIKNISTSNLAPGKYTIGWIITGVSGETVTSNNTAYCNTQLTVTKNTAVGTQTIRVRIGGNLTYYSSKNKFDLTSCLIENQGKSTLSKYKVNVYASDGTKKILLKTASQSCTLKAGKLLTLSVKNIPTKSLTKGKTYTITWELTDLNGKVITSNIGTCHDKLKV